MYPEPTSDKVTDRDQTIDTEKMTNKYNCSSKEHCLNKLKNMIVSLGKQFSENASMDFGAFKSLTLDSMQLTYLPYNFSHLMNNLLFLDLSNNALEELPHSLCQLTKLEQLKVDNNLLISLPSSLCELKHLKSLSLTCNQLKQLPDSLGCLFNLETLNLSNNQFVSLPVSCALLNKLSSLVLCNNKFVEIPECVSGGMKNLQTLDVSSNPSIFLNKPPASIHLTSFIAENNGNCSYFPQWILWIKYNKLKKISLNGSIFKNYSFPAERTALPITDFSMIQSNLSDNVIDGIVSNMVKLENLNLSNKCHYKSNRNNFWHTPFEYMRVYSTLKDVKLRSTSLPSVSNKIGQFCNLVRLDLSHNLLSWLPEDFCRLQNLEILLINNSKIIQLPADIGKLSNLKELLASQNTISSLPDSLFDLPNLAVLDLYDNCISEVPARITEMKKVEKLDLDFNFADPCDLKIRNFKYQDLKRALRNDLDDIGEARIVGVKTELDEDDSEGEPYHYSRAWSDELSDDCSSFSDYNEDSLSKTGEEETDNCKKSNEETTCKSPELENWEIPENVADNFEPCDVGLFRTQVNYFISASARSNYYCPADDHVKPVRLILAETKLLKTDQFEEGQFDDV